MKIIKITDKPKESLKYPQNQDNYTDKRYTQKIYTYKIKNN